MASHSAQPNELVLAKKHFFESDGRASTMATSQEVIPETIKAISNFAWPVLIAAALWYARSTLKELAGIIYLRIKSGAGFETPWLKMARDDLNVTKHADLSSMPGISSRKDDGERGKEYDNYYSLIRNLM